MKRFALISGCVVMALAWGIHTHSFTGHMTAHMAVVAIAAPLLTIGVIQTRWDPVRPNPRMFPAILASLVELAAVWAWHTPVLHHAAREHLGAFIAEQGSFAIAGLYLWLSVLGGEPAQRASRAAAGIIALLLTAMHMTLLGAVLALAPRPLYHSGLDDQQLGGAIMLLIGGISYLAGGLWLGRGLLRITGEYTESRRSREHPVQ